MDKNYIKENGILELYVLGELSLEENTQVENLLKTDIELQEECTAIENTLEALALENAIQPRNIVKDNILSSIKKPETISKIKRNKMSFFPYAAASVALLFLASSVFLYSKWQTAENDLQVLQEETSNLNNRLVSIESELKTTEDWYSIINSPSVSKFILEGNAKSPNSKAIAYINHKEKKVILNPEGLAKLDDDKTYQMWADVEGEMIDMGIIKSNEKMIAMTYIDNAESLNITIEPASGSDHPTVEQLITNIYL